MYTPNTMNALHEAQKADSLFNINENISRKVIDRADNFLHTASHILHSLLLAISLALGSRTVTLISTRSSVALIRPVRIAKQFLLSRFLFGMLIFNALLLFVQFLLNGLGIIVHRVCHLRVSCDIDGFARA